MKRLMHAGALLALGIGTTLAPAALCLGSANAATPDPITYVESQDFSANMKGQMFTLNGTLGGGLLGNLLSAEFSIGKAEMAVDSQGIGTLLGTDEGVPAGTKVGVRGEIATAGILGQSLHLSPGMSTAPSQSSNSPAWDAVGINLAPVLTTSIIGGHTGAHWTNDAFLKPAGAQSLANADETIGSIKLLDLGSLFGAASALLPSQLRTSLIEFHAPTLTGDISTIKNSDGTHGLRATGNGEFGEIDLFGGSVNGGVTLGIATAGGGDTPLAHNAVFATGKPGGAGCDYLRPDLLTVAFGSTHLSLPISVGQRVNLPLNLGYLDVDFLGQAHCEASADGTTATTTGGGAGLHLVIQAPGIGEIANLQASLPDLTEGTVTVPKGGIKGSDFDTDGDDLSDFQETTTTHTDPANPDTDGDRLKDGEEVNTYHTDPLKKDTDGDGMIDGDEILTWHTNPLKKDSDGDGLGDNVEVIRYKTDPAKADTDADGINDRLELARFKTNPLRADTDGDGLKDGLEVYRYRTKPLARDTDRDGLTDGLEVNKYKTNPTLRSSDRDSLSDGDEVLKYHSNPRARDTDHDRLKDDIEVLKYHTSPFTKDTDHDKLRDRAEIRTYHTNPLKKDTDGDGVRDGREVRRLHTNPLDAHSH
jgi:hypothetical protein